MSLLLDARKKSQHATSSQTGDPGHSGLELSLEPNPDPTSRPAASRNLVTRWQRAHCRAKPVQCKIQRIIAWSSQR